MPTAAPARKLKWILFATQALGSAGFVVASTVTPIVGAELSGRPALAGVPTAFYWAGGALATLLWGRLMDPIGRRRTLSAGLLLGAVGAVLAGGFVVRHSLAGFVLGLILMGGANSALQLARFMAGEVHRVEERGRAIATVVLGGTVGAVAGPALVAPASDLAVSWGGPALSGPFLGSAIFFLVGSAVVSLFLRPDPKDLAREVHQASELPPAARRARDILANHGVRVAIATMAVGQLVMVMLMVITSLHMSHHHHALSSIAAVMSSHVFGMYAFSVVSGRVADRFGRGPLIRTGAMVLVVACLTATISTEVAPLALSLFLLGLGWNFCYVGGSTLLSDLLTHAERARIQSINDFVLTSMAGGGSALSGLVFSALGYASMGYLSAFVSAALFFVSLTLSQSGRDSGRTR